jgi:zinc transporter ZupT
VEQLALKLRKQVTVIMAFAAGVLVAVPLFELLPESIIFGTRHGIPIRNIMYITGLGFVFLYFLERSLTVSSIYVGHELKH